MIWKHRCLLMYECLSEEYSVDYSDQLDVPLGGVPFYERKRLY